MSDEEILDSVRRYISPEQNPNLKINDLTIEQYLIRGLCFNIAPHKSLTEYYFNWLKQFGFCCELFIYPLLADEEHINFFMSVKNNKFLESEIYYLTEKVKSKNIVHEENNLFDAIKYIQNYNE